MTAVVAWPESPRDITFLYAPGAGSNIHDPFGRFICRELASSGVRAVRFQFPFQEAKRRAPDKTTVLEETWRAAITEFGDGHTIAGGRSMGGRIATHVAAQGGQVAGLALFAYPLHPPGKPDRSRTEHLRAIALPVLFCSGTRDAFGSVEELQQAAALVPEATLRLLDGADHGFNAPKASGRTRDDVYAEALASFREWLEPLV